MVIDGQQIIHRLTRKGFSKLEEEEQLWIVEMTKTRHPYWDPLIQEAYLQRSLI